MVRLVDINPITKFLKSIEHLPRRERYYKFLKYTWNTSPSIIVGTGLTVIGLCGILAKIVHIHYNDYRPYHTENLLVIRSNSDLIPKYKSLDYLRENAKDK